MLTLLTFTYAKRRVQCTKIFTGYGSLFARWQQVLMPRISERFEHKPVRSLSFLNGNRGFKLFTLHSVVSDSLGRLAPSPDNSLSDKSVLMLSDHLRFGLPILLFPGISITITLVSTYSVLSSIHAQLLSCSFLHISAIFAVPLILSFLVCRQLIRKKWVKMMSTPLLLLEQ